MKRKHELDASFVTRILIRHKIRFNELSSDEIDFNHKFGLKKEKKSGNPWQMKISTLRSRYHSLFFFFSHSWHSNRGMRPERRLKVRLMLYSQVYYETWVSRCFLSILFREGWRCAFKSSNEFVSRLLDINNAYAYTQLCVMRLSCTRNVGSV